VNWNHPVPRLAPWRRDWVGDRDFEVILDVDVSRFSCSSQEAKQNYKKAPGAAVLHSLVVDCFLAVRHCLMWS
jgi:hypothetical protein